MDTDTERQGLLGRVLWGRAGFEQKDAKEAKAFGQGAVGQREIFRQDERDSEGKKKEEIERSTSNIQLKTRDIGIGID
ncbi:MAG: hypothetical protein LAT79_13840 [Kiritimatiellae bacterium]|nr:hypothetical protein [Kiritimatiellia bacterium]